jgi:hypothetical protein
MSVAVEMASNMAVERSAGSPPLAAPAHRRRSPPGSSVRTQLGGGNRKLRSGFSTSNGTPPVLGARYPALAGWIVGPFSAANAATDHRHRSPVISGKRTLVGGTPYCPSRSFHPLVCRICCRRSRTCCHSARLGAASSALGLRSCSAGRRDLSLQARRSYPCGHSRPRNLRRKLPRHSGEVIGSFLVTERPSDRADWTTSLQPTSLPQARVQRVPGRRSSYFLVPPPRPRQQAPEPQRARINSCRINGQVIFEAAWRLQLNDGIVLCARLAKLR